MKRQHISSGTSWETTVGYSRAVRVGRHVHVAGTTAVTPDGHVVGPGNPYVQTKHILTIIASALEEAGATLADVVRTRIFVTDIGAWEEIGRAHGEAFADVRPAATMVEVRRLIHPDLLVEIEAVAILPEGD